MIDSPRGLRRTFQALGTRNYRLFFTGQAVSITGTWMQRVAQDWLILELGGGPLELSIGVGLQSVPSLLIGIWGGLLVDRGNARKLMLLTQTLLGSLALTLGVLTVTGHVTLTIVYLMAFGVGCLNVIDAPARQSFVVEMVGPDRAANAVSLNSSINNSARLIGPAVAGVVIGLAGSGVAFLLNAATFAAIVTALILIDPRNLHRREPIPRGRGQIAEGFRYALTTRTIRTPLVATLLVSAFAQNFRVTLPTLAVGVFGGGASRYGLLMSLLGVGAIGGALICAHLARPSLWLVSVAALGLGALILVASAAPTYAVLATAMVGVGAGNTSFNATSQSFILLRSAPGMRGRVMSIRQLVSNGPTPLGSVSIGWVCEVAGARVGLGVGGVVALLTAVLTWGARRTDGTTWRSRRAERLVRSNGEESAGGGDADARSSQRGPDTG